MTKWKEQFDERYVVPFDDGTNDKFINVNPNLIKDFVFNLIEQVIEDAVNYSIVIDKDKFKQYLRKKWL